MKQFVKKGKKTILITGGAGYIGSVLTRKLLKEGFNVISIDNLWFKKDVPLSFFNNPNYTFIKKDFGDKEFLKKIVDKVDFVIHLAAIVGEPASKLYPDLTKKVNYDNTIKLIDYCRSNVKGFIFFSTCSNYGIAEGIATEESPLNPLSLYAKTKVQVEEYLLNKVSDLDFLILRLSTVHGLSPRMRFDLTVNEFILKAFKDNYIDIYFPESNRPYIHVEDVANIVYLMLSKFDTVKNQVFNVGFNDENFQKMKIAQIAKELVPATKIEIVKEKLDLRDYVVDFSKLNKLINPTKLFTLEKSMISILNALENGVFEDTNSYYYYNTKMRI